MQLGVFIANRHLDLRQTLFVEYLVLRDHPTAWRVGAHIHKLNQAAFATACCNPSLQADHSDCHRAE